jgi:hypothetical protein
MLHIRNKPSSSKKEEETKKSRTKDFSRRKNKKNCDDDDEKQKKKKSATESKSSKGFLEPMIEIEPKPVQRGPLQQRRSNHLYVAAVVTQKQNKDRTDKSKRKAMSKKKVGRRTYKS